MFSRSTAQGSTPGLLSKGDASGDLNLVSPPEDSTSALSWCPVANYLAVASWDSKVRIYEVNPGSTGVGKATIDFDGPVLSCAWSPDGSKVVGSGADNTARLLDLGGNSTTALQVAAHDKPVRAVRFFQSPNANAPMIVTGSWDKTVKYWDLRQSTPIGKLELSDRVYAMDVKGDLLVIGDADLKVYMVKLGNPTAVYRARNSPLKHQIRTISCFHDASGFAMGAIEGRGAFQWVEDTDYQKSYTFKCHRHPSPTAQNTTDVYTVNAISTHPIHGTFSTAGSDGSYQFWDKERKCRLKEYPRLSGPISATGFSFDGARFAYAVTYDWSLGYGGSRQGGENRVGLHNVTAEDCQPRGLVGGRR